MFQQSNYNYQHAKSSNFDDLAEQKRIVKRELKKDLGFDQVWEPVPIAWFNNWKKYVDFDSAEEGDNRPKEEVEALKPGAIDNRSLKGDFGDELSRDISCDVDFVLLPEDTVNKLFKHYGSYDGEKTQRYGRSTRNFGTEFAPSYQVKLYPTRVEISHWDVKNKEIFGKNTFHYVKMNNTTVASYKTQIERMRNPEHVTYSEKFRVWIKLKANNVSAAEEELVEEGALRYVTMDKVSTVNGWKLMHEDSEGINIETLMTERNCVELLIEKIKSGYYEKPKWEDWPRYSDLCVWQDQLRANDVIDVRRLKDKKWQWLEAVVKSTDAEGAHIHYRTFDASEDELVPRSEFKNRLSPLQSHTVKWKNSIEEDDLVDVKFGGVWVQATVESIDTGNNSVKVCYNKALVDYLCTKKQEEPRAVESTSSTTTTTTNNNNSDSNNNTSDDIMAGNDDQKKIIGMKVGGSINSHLYSKNEIETAKKPSYFEPVVDSDPQFVWVQLSSENIAYIETHSAETRMSDKYLRAKKEAAYKVSYYDYGDRSSKGKPQAPGSVGLQNIGNTCYMNSMIQCLSHARPLREIFTTGKYRSFLNRDNPVGHGGRLAKSFAQLMKDIYSDNFTVLVPRQFKTTIGQCWNQFSQYDQQDSQELMGYLIDGLHEDLNRVIRKPYVQTIRGNNRPDRLVSRESWRRHLLRHDSEVNDVMYGQTKSKVICRNAACKKESVTFESYHCLSLPIPVNNKQTMRILVKLLPLDSAPFEVDVEFNAKGGDVLGLKSAILSRLVELNFVPDVDPAIPETKKYYHVYQNSYYNNQFEYQKEGDRITWFNAKTHRFAFFEIEHNAVPIESTREWDTRTFSWKYSESKKTEFIPLQLYSSKKKNYAHSYYPNDVEFLGLPVVLCIRPPSESHAGTTGSHIHERVRDFARRFVSADFTGEISSLYTVWSCNTYMKVDQVPDDDNVFKTTHSRIAIVWNDNVEPIVPSTKYELKGIVEKDGEESDGRISIYHCLDKFVEQEQLPEAETYYCNTCKQHLAPQKKLDIYATPDVLAIHLKRFQYTTSQYNNSVIREKIDDPIDYPIDGLDLTRYIERVEGVIDPQAPPIYDLVGVSLHSGSLYGGHYTAVCRDDETNQFFNFNDSHVSRCNPQDAISDRAYVLIYKRRQGTLKWSGIVPTVGEEVQPDDKD